MSPRVAQTWYNHGGGTGGGGGPTPDIEFDPADYASRAALLADTSLFDTVEDANTGEIDLVSAGLPSGWSTTKAMEYNYEHAPNGCNSITIGRRIAFTARQEVWGEFEVCWSDNFSTNNSGCYPNDHKLIFGDTTADESGRWAVYCGADSGPNHTWQLEISQENIGGQQGAFYMDDSPGSPESTAWDGLRHVIRLHIKHSTTASSGDGELQFWYDGVLGHDQSGISTTKPGGGADTINGFSFCHNKDDGPQSVVMTLKWGKIRIYYSNPGW